MPPFDIITVIVQRIRLVRCEMFKSDKIPRQENGINLPYIPFETSILKLHPTVFEERKGGKRLNTTRSLFMSKPPPCTISRGSFLTQNISNIGPSKY